MKFDMLMMETAILWSKASSCKRRQVGGVIAKDNRILLNGYNGTRINSSNDCEEQLVTCVICRSSTTVEALIKKGTNESNHYVFNCCSTTQSYNIEFLKTIPLTTKKTTLHAEANIIAYASREGIALKDTTMYVTTLPCIECAKLIYGSGISKVFYLDNYKDTSGLTFLKAAGIKMEQITKEQHEEIQ